jgi:thymidylate synthase (FAD)
MTLRPESPEAEEILGRYYPVLDHGFVSLVDYMGTDGCIERSARVSYGYGTRTNQKTRGLLRYLRRHLHTTPSEMVELKFHCAMPIFVARQWIRHRTANVNEYSGRYSLLPMLQYTPSAEQFQQQNAKNNQGRSGQGLAAPLYDEACERWAATREQTAATYGWLAEHEVARELARIDVPISTYTQWYWKIDLHNLLHFLTLRVDPHAQWEIREYARVMAGIMRRVVPLSYEAWIDYDVCGERLSRMELDALRQLLVVAEDGTVKVREGAQLTPEALSRLGLGRREIEEFAGKLSEAPVPTFQVSVEESVAPETFEERFAAAVPGVDKTPASAVPRGFTK